ncbi:ABC transporter permease [Nocardioides bigeumensis]
MTFLHGWAPVLRMARRDALRHKGRSALVLVLIALPVLAVTTAAVVYSTFSVNSVEALDRELGAADALVSVRPGQTRVLQGFDPDDLGRSEYDETYPEPTAAAIRQALGREVPLAPLVHGDAQFVTEAGVADVSLTELDLHDPLAEGMFELTSGRLPRSAGEIVVSSEVASRGPDVGSTLELGEGATYDVVGIVESTTLREADLAVGMPGALGLAEGDHYGTDYLVGGGPVSWDDVRAVNEIGGLVASRSVLTDPPPRSELPPEIQQQPTGRDGATVAVVGLIVVMVLLEVVLLAGPAFAVSARRQSRTIALIAASGGTPAQAQRLVLAGALVLGVAASVTGVVLGIVSGFAVLPAVQSFSSTWFGPFEVPWLWLVGDAAFGLASAVLAAGAPAWIASRQDVVAVLAGRRGDRAPSMRSPILGVVLVAVGTAAVLFGATNGSGGELAIAFGVLPAVLGMILLVPLVVAGLARAGGSLPLVLRYAVRDAARHRTRTVPAVAAVAATVAGVVAFGVGGSSDQAEQEAGYQPGFPEGMAVLTDGGPTADWTANRAAVGAALPGARVQEIHGVNEWGMPDAASYLAVGVYAGRSDQTPGGVWTGSMLGSVVVDDDATSLAVLGFADPVVEEARRTLEAGGIVGFADRTVDADEARLELTEFEADTGDEVDSTSISLPALWVPIDGVRVPQAVIPSSVAEEHGLDVVTTALVVSGAEIDEATEQDLVEALAARTMVAQFSVERGYVADDGWFIVMLILGCLGGVLVLGGTLTATFLALSDARPDLATLSAVGAAPRTGRGVASAYALVIGVTGAVLGAVLGFLPGIAITYPLTSDTWTQQIDPDLPSHYLDVPWVLVLGLVVGLPLLTAAVVGLTARSRLPLVARLD